MGLQDRSSFDRVHVRALRFLTNARYIRKNRRALRARADDLIKKPTYKNFERLLEPLVLDALAAHELPPWYDSLPSGLFDNSKIERFMRRNLERNGLPNTFRLMKLERSNELYICATNLNTAEGVVFGHDEDTSVTISQAVQASTAIPGFFKPATLNGVDYLDAGFEKQRISPRGEEESGSDHLLQPLQTLRQSCGRPSDGGVSESRGYEFHHRSESNLPHVAPYLSGLDKLRLDPSFKGVIVIEPREHDVRYFNMNQVAFCHRTHAAL